MKLIGMLDSPYVRRTAISLEVLGVHFEHEAVSVFSTFEKFQAINPVVKAPTLAKVVPAAKHPGLVELSNRLEQTAEFRKYPPDGPGV